MNDDGYPSAPSPSIEQTIWAKCQEHYGLYMGFQPGDPAATWDRAKAEAFAEAVALIRNPYAPDVAQVRREVKQAWSDSNG